MSRQLSVVVHGLRHGVGGNGDRRGEDRHESDQTDAPDAQKGSYAQAQEGNQEEADKDRLHKLWQVGLGGGEGEGRTQADQGQGRGHGPHPLEGGGQEAGQVQACQLPEEARQDAQNEGIMEDFHRHPLEALPAGRAVVGKSKDGQKVEHGDDDRNEEGHHAGLDFAQEGGAQGDAEEGVVGPVGRLDEDPLLVSRKVLVPIVDPGEAIDRQNGQGRVEKEAGETTQVNLRLYGRHEEINGKDELKNQLVKDAGQVLDLYGVAGHHAQEHIDQEGKNNTKGKENIFHENS